MALRVNEYRNNAHQAHCPMAGGQARSFGSAASECHRHPEGTVSIRTATELGTGTGHFSGALGRRIPDLFAMEPNERMREIFRDTCPGIFVLDGTAEEIPLENNDVDAVFAADAAHWSNTESTRRETARVPRSGGWLGVSWNPRHHATPWLARLFSSVDAPHDPDRLTGRPTARAGERAQNTPMRVDTSAVRTNVHDMPRKDQRCRIDPAGNRRKAGKLFMLNVRKRSTSVYTTATSRSVFPAAADIRDAHSSRHAP